MRGEIIVSPHRCGVPRSAHFHGHPSKLGTDIRPCTRHVKPVITLHGDHPVHARGVSWLQGFRPVGAGIEPATLGLLVRCSTRLSYPVARRAGIEPATSGITCRYSSSELTSTCSNTFVQVSAYTRGKTPRTGWAFRTHAAETCRLMLRIAGCFSTDNSYGRNRPNNVPIPRRTEAPRCSARAPVAAAPSASARARAGCLRAEEIFREPDA